MRLPQLDRLTVALEDVARTYRHQHQELIRLRAENDRLRAELARAGVETRP